MRVGVDLVVIDRIADDMRRWGPIFIERILTRAEAAWCAEADEPARRVAACLAAKESVVKVIGGRPAGFAWPALELRADTTARTRLCDSVLVEHADDGQLVGRWTCDPGGGRTRVQTAAAARDGRVVALAVAG